MATLAEIAAPSAAGEAPARDTEAIRERIRGAVADFLRGRREQGLPPVRERRRGRLVPRNG